MQERVFRILTEISGMEADRITLESGLAADLDLSSLDVVNAVVMFEEEFGIEIPDDDIWELVTAGDVISYLEKRIQP